MRYEFLIDGTVSGSVRAAFPELTPDPSDIADPADTADPTGNPVEAGTRSPAESRGGTATRLCGDVVDDAHLHGVLGRFQALGLSVIGMRRLPEVHDRAGRG